MIASPTPTWSAEAVVRAVWTPVAEAPEALAERTEAFTQMMRDRLGISVWQVSSPQNRDTMTPWPRTPEERATVVAQQRSTAGFADPTAWNGYSSGWTASPSASSSGFLLSLPDDWSPEQVVDGVLETFDLNGLDEIPH